MVSCKDLLGLNIFKNIKLVAGNDGIYNNISWPYICQTLDFSQWINGGELMFLTGMGMDLSDERIKKLINECVKKEISGLVILTNSEYISNISQEVIAVANELGLPLFDMPWNIKLIDVNREIANYIMELNLNQNKENEFLSELLFTHNLDEKVVVALINQSKFKLDKNYFASNIKLIEKYEWSKMSLECIKNMMKSMMEKHNLKSILGLRGDNIVCLIELDKQGDFTAQKNLLISIYNEVSKYNKLSLSIGCICENILKSRQSYDEANRVYKLYKSNDWDLRVIDYESIGFYKILFEVSNYEKLREYCYEVLADIIKDDKNSNLLKTLRIYLRNNCNLINTSKEMYIHRNTLIYRLNKIKTALNINLENPILKNELMNAIMIYDYLNYVDSE